MPTATPRPPRPLGLHASPERRLRRIAVIAGAAAAYAASELLVTVFIGGFFAWGRAEALLFLAFRPWLLLAAVIAARDAAPLPRYLFYASALLLAGLSQSLFLLALGAGNPWPEAARGLVAGAALALLFDLVLQLGNRLGGRLGRSIAIGLVILLLVVPNALAPYAALIARDPAAEPASKQDLMLMSALPLMWGEKGPLDPSSRSAAAYEALATEFRIRTLDVLDERSLSGGRLLLMAQPRALAPEELAALDAWVRRGGRVLILTDPQLVWPSELPLGHLRRAPAIGLLGPLLTHWGLSLDPPGEPEAVTAHLRTGRHLRRLVAFAPGVLTAAGGACRVGPTRQVARCRLGVGSAILLADADMLHNHLWVGPGPSGPTRGARVSDNPLIVADWLDELAGNRRRRSASPIQWLEPTADRNRAWLLALLPIVAAGALAASLGLRRRT